MVTDRTGALDVLLDGHRVWSIDLDEVPPGRDGVREFAWPAALAQRLDGTARLDLAVHGSSHPVASVDCRFGSSPHPVVLSDARGRLLSVSKWGRLNQSFADLGSDELAWYLDRTEQVLRLLADDWGRPAFLAYGSLLGAVRSGHFIGHDMDVDLAYLARARTPVDAVRESFDLERLLRARGWTVRRQNGGFLQLFFPQPGGGARNLDVFTALCEPGSGRLYVVNDTMVDGGASLVLPLSSVSVEGRALPAPRAAASLLEAAYGAGWRVPDPGFRYGASPGKRQMKEWFGGFREDRDQWNRFFRDTPDLAPRRPSPFAAWVAGQARAAASVVDVGCGLGRDTRLYGRRRPAVGLDVSSWAVRRARRRTPARNRATFEVLNLGSLRQTLPRAALLARRLPAPRAVTALDCLDAMHPAGRENLWPFCRMLLQGGGRAYVEFAAAGGLEEFRAYPGMRRFVLDPQDVAAAAERHGGVVESIVLLPAEEEERLMCRMVVAWP